MFATNVRSLLHRPRSWRPHNDCHRYFESTPRIAAERLVRTRADARAGLALGMARDSQLARLAHRRVIALPGEPAVGLEDLLSNYGVYAQQRVARRVRGPAFVRRGISRLRSRLPRSSPKVRIVVWSTV